MKASERLRALETDVPSSVADLELWRVLPELVAVVEAAERVVRLRAKPADELLSALDALAAKLNPEEVT